MKCVNCGKSEAPETICLECRQTYPGDPAVLENLIHAFKMYHIPIAQQPGGDKKW